MDSIARLDEIQSVAESQLWPTGFSLSDDLREILRSQVSFFLGGLSGDEFAGWAALLKYLALKDSSIPIPFQSILGSSQCGLVDVCRFLMDSQWVNYKMK